MKILAPFFLLTLMSFPCLLVAQNQADVIIIGGGAGGTSAAIQAARMGTRVQLIESTSWLGGMLTSAGVSAIDGNHKLPSGIWGEFREALYAYYGGPDSVATGWVSHTLFEPSVGNRILQQLAAIPNVQIAFNAKFQKVERKSSEWLITYLQKGKKRTIRAPMLIDATETGDLLPLLKADFRVGMDAKEDTGEQEAPKMANQIVQDLTYTAILKDVSKDTRLSKSKKGLVKKPKNYNPGDFACACKREAGDMFGSVSDCKQMLDYAKLPNDKYLINWPNCGNDFYLNWPELSLNEQQEQLQKAKAFTQGFLYYIQNELGFQNLRLADEFPTKDRYPMIPYHREARRVKGKVFLTVDHLERPYDFDLYKTGIAVGDYPIDHHHDKNPEAPEIEFINIKVPSYNIPLGTIVPENIPNFLVAEKNISVSNIANGTTRLQPVVMGIGQAAGTLAAIAVHESKTPSEVSIRTVQQSLLENNAYLMPFIDVAVDDPAFSSIQKIGATGILQGFGVPYKWANQTWFYPERMVSEYEWKIGLLPYFPEISELPASGGHLQLDFLKKVVQRVKPTYNLEAIADSWQSWNILQTCDERTPLTRRTLSILTDKILEPFERSINWEGHLLKE